MKTWLSLAGLCALIGVLLGGTHQFTEPMIQANRQAALRAALIQVAKPYPLPNPTPEFAADTHYLEICRELTVQAVQARGYGGPIHLLVAHHQPQCSATTNECPPPQVWRVQVSRHSETPGIGDFFEQRNPNWLTQLQGLTGAIDIAENTTGQTIDAVAGATITANAIVQTVAAAANAGNAIHFSEQPCSDRVSTSAHELTP